MNLFRLWQSLAWFLGMAPPAGSWGQTVVISSEVSLRSKAGFCAYLFLMLTVFTNPPSSLFLQVAFAVEPSGDVHEERQFGFSSELLGWWQCSCEVPQRA